MNLEEFLQATTKKLAESGVSSARLDAELIVARGLKTSRETLLAHPERTISKADYTKLQKDILKRTNRVPLAYILGTKEFFGRDFLVTPDTLIPRPETENIVELFGELGTKGRILDVGTGSGCIGLTIKAEFPETSVTISDISPEALSVARKNAQKLGIKPIRFVHSDLLEHWLSHQKPKKFDTILANLPYVDKAWQASPETSFEPATALFSSDKGLEHTKRLIQQASRLLVKNGYLLLEIDPRQHTETKKFAKKYGLHHKKTEGFVMVYKHQA